MGVQNIIISDINSITNNKGGIICFDTLSSFLAYYSKQCIDGKTTLDMDNPDENDAIAMRKLVSILKGLRLKLIPLCLWFTTAAKMQLKA